MRYEPQFAELARLREEDDPNLPMGDWERPLQKADWGQVAEACIRILREDSKDFQIAAWLCDAWIRTGQAAGLRAGLGLIKAIAQQYWSSAWPAMTAGDTERRIAPFIWLNSNLPLTIRLNVILIPTSLLRTQATTLRDWQDAPLAEDTKSTISNKPSRREIREKVTNSDRSWLARLAEDTAESIELLQHLTTYLEQQLNQDAPSLTKLKSELEQLQAAVSSLQQSLPLVAPDPNLESEARSAAISNRAAKHTTTIYPIFCSTEQASLFLKAKSMLIQCWN